MMHFTPRATRGSLLYRDDVEARLLWLALVTRLPRIPALLLMPDHVHLLAEPEARDAVGRAMRAYALRRNRLRGESGRVWAREDFATPVADTKHARRVVRYVYLNPVRAGLVDDPLAWPFSTLRDALGLAIPPARPPVSRPEALLAYVGRDADTGLAGSRLPEAPRERRPLPAEVIAAVSALTRMPPATLRDRPRTRRLLLGALRALTAAPAADLARAAGVSLATAYRTADAEGADVARIARVCGDPRFAALDDADLRRRWPRYADRR